jgi:hypothetical protein
MIRKKPTGYQWVAFSPPRAIQNTALYVEKFSPQSPIFSTYCLSVNFYHYILTSLRDSLIVFWLAEILWTFSQVTTHGERGLYIKTQ